MLRRSLVRWLPMVPALPLIAKAATAEAAPAAPQRQGPTWLCPTCKVSEHAADIAGARTALAIHCTTPEHHERLELSERVRVLKGQIKRKRRGGESVRSGYAIWFANYDVLDFRKGP